MKELIDGYWAVKSRTIFIPRLKRKEDISQLACG